MGRVILVAIASLIFNSAVAKQIVNVAAAANVRDAMTQIKSVYESENSDVTINVVYGASGVMVQQIVNGANFELFLSADEEFAERLKADGFGIGDVVPYAVGQLVLYSRSIDLSVEGLDVLFREDVRRVAVANPKVATYGTRAVEMLVEKDMYESVKPKLIFGANIAATAQYVFTENVEVGFVALSQVKSPKAEMSGYAYVIPREYYNPIVQSCVLVNGASQEAEKFRKFILADECKVIWREYGYE